MRSVAPTALVLAFSFVPIPFLPAQAGPVTFARTDYSIGGYPGSVAIGDMNGDGKRDLVVARYDSVTVLLGNGNGSFDVKGSYQGGGADFVAIDDLNSDGKPDLAVVSKIGHSVQVLLGIGDGSFGPWMYCHSGGRGPTWVATGDLNGDGKPDLAITDTDDDHVYIYYGNGDGHFVFGHYIDLDTPVSVAIADLNADGKLDLAVADGDICYVSVSLGNGNGTISPWVRSGEYGWYPYYMSIIDLNVDGKLDLVAADGMTNKVWVCLGNGDGTFAPRSESVLNVRPVSAAAIGDLNGDDNLDLVLANPNHNSISVSLGNGAVAFAPPDDYPTGQFPVSVALADLNGDAKSDLVVANGSSQTVSVLINTSDYPVSVSHARLEARVMGAGVEIRWKLPANQSYTSLVMERAPAASGPWIEIIPQRHVEGDVWVAFDATADPANVHWYRLTGRTASGSSVVFGPVEARATAEHSFELSSPWPNPSAGAVSARFSLPRAAAIRLSVMDIQGREVQVLAQGIMEAGSYEARWDGRTDHGQAAEGIYFVRYTTPDIAITRRIAIAQP